MRVYRGIASIDDALRGAVLTVGNFDGVHLGHQRILRTAHGLARVSNGRMVAMTFEPHPVNVLRPEEAAPRLTPWEEKLALLESCGAEAVIRLETDWPLLSLSAEDFVREVLVKRIHPSYLVEGPNFGFGRDRTGDIETLRRLSDRGGYQVHVVEPYRLHGAAAARIGEVMGTADAASGAVVVSSTVVRRLLAAGAVDLAAVCLGRPYALAGLVVHGAGAGRKMGYPTINLDVGSQLIPAEGVYAGSAVVAGLQCAAAISIGRRPTLTAQAQRAGLVGEAPLVVEAFILDETGDWYAERARLEFAARLRDQRRFESREALTAQISEDIQRVREIMEPSASRR